MAYKAYIRQDYKAVIVWEPEYYQRYRLRRRLLATALCGLITLVGYAQYSHLTRHNGDGWSLSSNAQAHIMPDLLGRSVPDPSHTVIYYDDLPIPPRPAPARPADTDPPAQAVAMLHPVHPPGSGIGTGDAAAALVEDAADSLSAESLEAGVPEAAADWETVTVKRGDSMALIFSRLGLSAADLHEVMQLGEATASLKRILPGQELRILIDDEGIRALQYEPDAHHILHVERSEHGFVADRIEAELTARTRAAVATIDSSLFLAGQRAGLSDNLIMQLVALYGWDIDFAMDIRSGDEFRVIYQESYRNGVKVKDGPILAAEFNNRGRTLRTVRYIHEDGSADYYSDSGDSMRKAFIRTPLDVYRISSHFGPRRHPVLHSMRMHRGVDYAAPTGTPIRAAGDGRVAHIGRKGGYGNTIILRHGGRYSTLYAHMSRYANGLKQGSTVKQGQVIGYVGATGMATGPHLHYEFQVDGVHKDPLKVELPQAEGIPKERLVIFKSRTRPLLAELDGLAAHNGSLQATDLQLDEAVLVALHGDALRD